MEEAKTVKYLLSKMPAVPKSAGEEYFLVAMDWWKKWQQYTLFN